MAGWKTEQIYGTMPGMLNLAAGAGTDLARTADIVSDNMTAMGVPVEKASHFMDVYAYALTNSNVNLESLGETMKYAAPVAAAFGASLEDTAAMTMMMGNAGIKGSMAGTALRMGLLRLSGPPKKASKAMNELGISVSDATAMAMESEAELARLGVQYDKNAPPMEKMGNIITQLSTKMQGLSREEKLASIGAIFGANAASGWVNIIEQGPEVFNKYLSALKECDGYSEQFAHTMNDDTRGAMIILESSLDALQNSVGTALLPAVRSAAEAFTPLVSAAAIWIGENPQIVQGAAAIAAGLSAVMIGAAGVKLAFAGWGFITAQVELVKASLLALRTGMTGLAGLSSMATFGGWGAIFGGIAAKAVAAKTAIVGFFSSLTLGSAASGAAAGIKAVGSALLTAGKAAMGFAFSPVGIALMALAAAGYYVYTHWSQVAPIFSNLASTLGGALSGAIQTISAAFQNLGVAVSNLSPAFSNLGGVIFGALATVLNVVVHIAATIISTFANAVATVISFFGNLGQAISAFLAGDFSKMGEHLKQALVSALEGVFNTIKALAGGLLDTITSIFDPIKTLTGKTASGGGSFGKQEITQKVEHEVKVTMDATNFASTFQNALQVTQQQNPQADLSQLTQTISAVAAQMKENPQANPDQLAQAVSSAIEATKQQNPDVDLSAIVQAATAAFQPASENVQQATQNIAQAGEACAQLPAAVQPAAEGMNALNSGMQTANAELMTAQAGLTANNSALTANNSALATTSAGLSAFNSALSSTNGGLSSLASSSSSAAGAVSSLGSAASSAVSAMQSAAANAASTISAAASAAAAKPAANYAGGIYNKGAFLTWFAEKSPEAAIPLDKSARAISLWQKAGQLLGILPKENTGGYDQPAANETVSARQPKFDELGNIIGLHGLKDNIISKDDDIQVTNSKKAAQLKEWQKKYPAPKSVTPKTAKPTDRNGIFSGLGNIFDFLPQIPNLDGFNFNSLETKNILPENPLSKIKNQTTNDVFPEAVKQSKTFQNLQAAKERFSAAAESDSIFGKAKNFESPAGIENIFSGIKNILPFADSGFFGNFRNIGENFEEGIFQKLTQNLTSSADSFDSVSPIDLKFEINIQGNANAADVQNGIQQSIPLLTETLERHLAEINHEKQRRSFS